LYKPTTSAGLQPREQGKTKQGVKQMKSKITDTIYGHRTLQSASCEIKHLNKKTGTKWKAVWHGENGGYFTVEKA